MAIGLSSPPTVAAPNCPELRPRLRSPQSFVAGLAARHCLYIVPAHMSRPAPIFRISSGRRLRGPVWSPTKPELAIAFRRGTGFEVAVVGTAGEPLRRFLGRDATFFRDGRMLLRRRDQLRLVAGNVTTTLLAAGGRLRRAAGFPVTGYDLSGTDGYGRAGAIVVVWAELRSRVLLVRPNGTLVRVSPIYEAEAGESMPGLPAWSPDGRILLIPWQHDHPTIPLSHEHCLARWTAVHGYRATVCRNPHFDRILWHPDGGTALLNNGLVVARDGTVRARVHDLGRAMSVRWKRPLLAHIG